MDLVDKSVDKKKTQSADCPFRWFFPGHAKQSVFSDTEKISTKSMRTSLDISSEREDMASTSGIYSEVLGEEFVGNNGSLLSLQPWIFKRAKCSKPIEEKSDSSSRWSFDWSGFSWTSHGSPVRINPGSHSIDSRKRRQYGQNFRPVTFSEKFFLPHHCNKNIGIEEYTFNFHPSSSINDERLSRLPRRIDTRSREDNIMSVDSSVERRPEKRRDSDYNCHLSSVKVPIDEVAGSVTGKSRTTFGVPHLPLQRSIIERSSRDSTPRSLDASFLQKCKISDPIASLDGMFLFLLGIAMGVASNAVSHRMEIDKLNTLLEDNKNLVQDLHEELEMKDSFTLMELDNGTNRNKELEHSLDESISAMQIQNSNWQATALKMDDSDNVCVTKVREKNLSEIEAELEAELEKLELNINASGIGQEISDLSEFDSELIADVVSGNLREDLLVKCMTDDEENPTTSTTSSTAQIYNANYSVSPKELSLRLHKVIEFRLEERIKELETALEEAEMKLKLVEAERQSAPKPPFSSSDTASSNFSSPKSLKQKRSSLRLDLSGDALIAYDEAFDEFMRLADTEDDDKLTYLVSSEGNNLQKCNEKEQVCEQILWRSGSYDISATDDDDGDDDDGDDGDGDDGDDDGEDLIQKILEKTRKGSPALLNAQKMFLMMDL